MNSGYLQLGGPTERPSTLELIPVATKEFRRYMVPLASIFALIALAVLGWGMLRSPTYKSSTTILVEDKNILAPLMEGRVVATGDTNRAAIANQVIVSRRIMDDILRTGGWMDEHPSAMQQERLIAQIQGRTTVEVTDRSKPKASDPGLSLIKITYADSDPQRAQRVTARYGELLISETAAAKQRESREAFQFIDSQVKKYENTMMAAGVKLQGYRNANPDSLPGADVDVAARIGELRRTIDTARMDLADLRSQEAQVRAQLSGESEIGNGLSRAGQFNARMAEMQAERARLVLNYTSAHPDVVRIEHQMQQLQQQYRAGGNQAVAGAVGASSSVNPLYSQLRGNLASVRQQAAAAAARLSSSEAMLAREQARSRNIFGSEGTLTALTTDHDVNRELYQDLLRRRENARVAMSLDAGELEANFHVQEPATVPMRPTGLRLAHFASAGLLLALVIPLVLLSLLVKHDPRVRSPVQIERDLALPVLGTIPAHYNRHAQTRMHHRSAIAIGLFLAVPMIYGLVLILKSVQGP